MAVFKCKMCGGDLNIADGSVVAVCQYCETKQTVPSADNEKKLNLFNRANRLRLNSEFDMAAAVYENIVAEFPEEAEAYWGLCLCNYGIEYVDDPATGRKMPTCHRASFESLAKDDNFRLSMEYADIAARKVYRDEAREIDRIMDEILSISKNEDPYDVFICYKETDSETGERTVDSVLAYDIYDALTAKGFKVFFSRVTLEEKLGRQYEPYIFAALNSAKVMLAVGTKYEYFHAVWVKNEWSRFLKLMSKDKNKLLIPCYKDMDAYDLPDEFRKLQAQDLGKLGAVQDIVRGIEKIIPIKTGASQTVTSQTGTQQTVIQSAGPNTEALLKRGFMALEDGKFDDAKVHFDKVLDIDAECAESYLGLAMADEKTLTKREFIFKNNLNSGNYKRAIQFASPVLLSELNAYEEERKAKEEADREKRNEEKYIKAKNLLENGKYKSASDLLLTLGDYKDSKKLLNSINYTAFAKVRQNGKWGFIDETGAFVIKPIFDDAGGFAENGLANVRQNKKYGFIDETGAFVIKPRFDDAKSFAKNGLAKVRQNGKYGFIDETGAFVIEPMFDNTYGSADGFAENGLAAVKQNGKWGFIDETGAFVIKPIFDDAGGFAENGLANVQQNKKYGFIDETGAFVIKPIFDYAGVFAENGLARVRQNGKYGFIDKTGAFVIKPMFDRTWGFAENGLASVEQNEKWGFIDKTGAFVIKPIFDFAGVFAENGLAEVMKNVKFGFIDENGAFVIKPIFDVAGDFYIILQADIEKRQARVKAAEEKARLMTEVRKQQGLCIHCGGEFKGLFTKKCSRCGKEKDY